MDQLSSPPTRLPSSPLTLESGKGLAPAPPLTPHPPAAHQHAKQRNERKTNKRRPNPTQPKTTRPKCGSLGLWSLPGFPKTCPLAHQFCLGSNSQAAMGRPTSYSPLLEGARERSGSTLCACPESRADRAQGLRWRPLLLSAGPRPLLPAAPGLRRSLQRSTLSEPELEIFCELLKQQTPGAMRRRPCSPAPPAGELRNRQASTCCPCIYSWWEG